MTCCASGGAPSEVASIIIHSTCTITVGVNVITEAAVVEGCVLGGRWLAALNASEARRGRCPFKTAITSRPSFFSFL